MTRKLLLRSVWRHLCAGRERAGVHSGWALIAWGVAGLLATPDYAGLSRYGSPVVWAVLPALLGAVQLASVLSASRSRQRTAGLAAAGVWGFLEIFLFTAHAHVVMLAIIPTFVLANALDVIPTPNPFHEESHALPNTAGFTAFDAMAAKATTASTAETTRAVCSICRRET